MMPGWPRGTFENWSTNVSMTDLPLTGRKPSINSLARSDHTVASARREAVKVLLDGGDCSVDTWDMHSQIRGLLLSTPRLKKYALNRFNVLSEPSCPVPWAWVSNDYLTGDDAGKNTLPFTVINPSTMRHWSPLDPLCTSALSAYNSRSVSIKQLERWHGQGHETMLPLPCRGTKERPSRR
jgi:hypothetical protein